MGHYNISLYNDFSSVRSNRVCVCVCVNPDITQVLLNRSKIRSHFNKWVLQKTKQKKPKNRVDFELNVALVVQMY